jgi:hypothetical protein
MSGLLLAARLVVAAVLALAAVGKLLDLSGARRSVREFGVPVRLAEPVVIVLPLVEIAAAVALVGRGSARWGALGALVLLGLFTVGIVRVLAQGRHPDCHCFGQLHSMRAGRGAVLRNLLLAGVAGFILAAGWSDHGASATDWLGRFSPGVLTMIAAAAAAMVLQALFSSQLLRQQGRLLLRIEQLETARPALPQSGLAQGRPAPDFSVAAADGESRSLSELREGARPLLLVFSDPGCGPCRALLPELLHWHLEHARALRLVVLSRLDGDASLDPFEQSGLLEVLEDTEWAVRDRYGVHGVPAAVLVDRNGRIAAPAALGHEAIRSLVETAVRDSVSGDAPGKFTDRGDPVPPQLHGLLAGAIEVPPRTGEVGQEGNGR